MTLPEGFPSIAYQKITVGSLLLIIGIYSVTIMPWLSLNQLIRIDRTLMLGLNNDEGQWMDQFWYAYSSFDAWTVAMAVIALTLWRKCKGCCRQRLLFLLTVVLLFVLLDQLSSGLIKPLAGRLRPSHDPVIAPLLHYVNGYHGGRYGFVSGHATNIAGLATWLCLLFRDRLSRTVFILFAAALCYSRIYLGVHYPGDILCGALLGFTLSYAIFRIVSRYFSFQTNRRPRLLLYTIGLTVVVLFVYSACIVAANSPKPLLAALFQ
ncbi:MAG: phosphatase PAP2 family protein [Prevotella sp.]|jgi:undecaprenyl-diphosphatase